MRDILVIILVIIVVGCSGQSKKVKTISGFDISRDCSQILYSQNIDGQTTLFIKNIEKDSQKLVLKTKEGKFHRNPQFSKNEEKILFIEYDITNYNQSSLCISNVDGSNKKNLIEGKGIISEAIFSDYTNKIYFLMANEYDSYSPIGVKAAHGFDIFSYNLDNNEIEKLSNLNAYGIDHLFELDSLSFLLHISNGKDGGIHILNKSYPDDPTRIVPKNDPRGAPDLYRASIYSEKDSTLIFTAPYEIYIMDINDKIGTLLYRSFPSNITDFNILTGENKVIFTKNNSLEFYKINFDGSGLEKIGNGANGTF